MKEFAVRARAHDDLRRAVNAMRERFELPGTPIRIALREKKNPYEGKRKKK